MRNVVVAAAAIALMQVSLAGAAAPTSNAASVFGERTKVWTTAALATRPAISPEASYPLDWQRELLAFQLAYGRSLLTTDDQSSDPITTGSIQRN